MDPHTLLSEVNLVDLHVLKCSWFIDVEHTLDALSLCMDHHDSLVNLLT